MESDSLPTDPATKKIAADRAAVAYRADCRDHAGNYRGGVVSEQGAGHSGDADAASQAIPTPSGDRRGAGLDLGVWAGIKDYGVTLRDLTGGRWSSAKDVLTDVGLERWSGSDLDRHSDWGRASVGRPIQRNRWPHSFPESPLEIALWIGELDQRGIRGGGCLSRIFSEAVCGDYRQRVGGSLLQGLLFGCAHGYQGLRNVVMIVLLGWLYGVVALWRGSLARGSSPTRGAIFMPDICISSFFGNRLMRRAGSGPACI